MLQKKVDWINKAEEALDIAFNDFQLGILLANQNAVVKRREGKSFALSCKAIMECTVSEDPIEVLVVSSSKASSKYIKDMVEVILKNMKIDCRHTKSNEYIVNDSVIKFCATNELESTRGYRFNFILLDEILSSPSSLLFLINSLVCNEEGKIIYARSGN